MAQWFKSTKNISLLHIAREASYVELSQIFFGAKIKIRLFWWFWKMTLQNDHWLIEMEILRFDLETKKM